MERKDIDKNYKWDLREIYSSQEKYQEDINEVKTLLEKILTFKDKVLESSTLLLEVLTIETSMNRKLNKLFTFINLNYTLDTRDSSYTKELGHLIDFASEIEEKTSFITTELSKLTEEKLEKFLEEKEELKKYEFSLRKIIRNSKYILSLEKEELLSKLSPLLSAGDDIFEKLDNADVDYGEIEDSTGKKHVLTGGTYQSFITAQDRTLRKNAVYAMHEFYKKHANTIAECLKNNTKGNTIIADIRGYESALEASLMDDDITVNFYNSFIESIRANIKTLHRMIDLYKKAMKLDEMHIYDINAKVGKNLQENYSVEDMKQIVKSSLEVLGDKYLEIVDKAWNENWVDFYETKGKRSGAFSSGTYDTKPYILLNYTGSFNDVETLAHELGHSIHSYYANKNQDEISSNYPIFLAEIASTTHEILLNDYLLKNAKDKQTKIFILNNILSSYKSTVFRQTEFAEFEKIIHERTQNGENLTCEDFTNIYMNLQNFYYDNLVNDDIIKYECFRIPHFYHSFYVYKYATGLCIAYKFAKDILEKKENATENYIKFLSSGGKNYPLEILKECGIDLEKNDVVKESITIIESYLDEFETLTEKE